MFDFSEKVVIVTGAAGNLGRAVVKAFLECSAVVCALDYKQDRLKAVLNLKDENGKLHLFENVDITDLKAVLALAEQVHARIGKVDILVNTVGDFTSGEMVHEISMSSFTQMMALNVYSFLNLTHAFVPAMLENDNGKIISVGSRASIKGSAKTGAYAAAKGALLRLTESMAAELLPHNIQANCVLPGVIDTPENRKAMPNADVAKWVSPDRVAQVILFLSSSDSDAISGAAIPIFGRS